MTALIQDIRFGLRMLAKSPGYTGVVVVTLALAIGANTAIFSVVYAALWQPLPFPHSDRLIRVFVSSTEFPNGPTLNVTLATFRAWHDHNRTLEKVAAFLPFESVITGGREAEKIRAAAVSEDFFPLLGVRPYCGRFFAADEVQPGKDGVVVLSYGLWQRRFGVEGEVIGRQVILNDRAFTVIGVLPQGFRFVPLGDADAWVPVSIEQPPPGKEAAKSYLNVLARLQRGVTEAQAHADLDALAAASDDGRSRASVVTLAEDIAKGARRALLILLGAVAVVLLIACVNVANLELARSITRAREVAIRMAMGATRWRVIRQLLVESGILALTSGFTGVFLAWWSVRFLLGIGASGIPRANDIGIHPCVLAFTLTVSLFTGVLFELVPAVQVTRPTLDLSLKEGEIAAGTSRRQNRLHGILLADEVALSLLLLVGAGLMINTTWRLLHTVPGFDTKNLLTMQVDLPFQKYRKLQAENFRRSALERLTALHGVQAAAFCNTLPMGGWETHAGFFPDGNILALNRMPIAQLRIISPGYFRAMRIPLLEGRFFTDLDTEDKPRVAIVSEALARLYFGGRALGRQISQGPGEPLVQIVGVTADIRFSKPSSEPLPTLYYPFAQEPQDWHMLAVRTSSDPTKMISDIRGVIHGLDPNVPVSDMMTMDQRVSQALGTSNFLLCLLVIFAGVALILVGVGAYSVISYSVARRTHEIGVRMAFGARREDVLKAVLRQARLPILAGVAIGWASALAATCFLTSFLYGVTSTDPAIYVCASVLLTGVALFGCWLPARRATKIEPMEALRYE